MATKTYQTKVSAMADVSILKALGAAECIPQPKGYVVDAPDVDQAELDAVLALLDGERRTPAVVAMAVKSVTGRTVIRTEKVKAGRSGRRTIKDTAPVPKAAQGEA